VGVRCSSAGSVFWELPLELATRTEVLNTDAADNHTDASDRSEWPYSTQRQAVIFFVLFVSA
jgi:hypothetical protein